MADRPLVSAIVIFLNEERFLSEAIQSVFAQTYDNWELLLVDDGSTDGSTEIARTWARQYPQQVHYLEHEGRQNRGMSAARNLGIRHARGQYVAFLDGDDVWLPEKLARQTSLLAARPEAAMVYGPTRYWHTWPGSDVDGSDFTPPLDVAGNSLYQPGELLTALYPLGPGQAPCMCSLLIRRDVLLRIGGFEERFAGFFEDQAFLVKVYLNERVFVSTECWDKYRIHANSCSADVARRGAHGEYRRAFLEWLRTYFIDQHVQDENVWRAFNAASHGRDEGAGQRNSKWFLRIAEGNQARLVRSVDGADVVRVEIIRTVSNQAYDTQLNLNGFSVGCDEECVLSFRVRADAPREMAFGFAMGHSPWSSLGLYDHLMLSPEWQHVVRDFRATSEDRDARILFDLGGSDASVEIDAVSLFSRRDGELVELRPPAAAVGDAPQGAPIEPYVPVNEIDFGSFRRLTPISRDFGCDRGRPIDRYYIESFLERHSADIHGRVLEVGENTYTRMFGGDRVTISDMLHVTEGEPRATIIADIAAANHIPSDAFDCVIFTQTLQLIYDLRAGIETLHRILKPGGVLLATFPGITQSYDHEWKSTWYWNLTEVSARRLFEEGFSPGDVSVESTGNVLAAMAFLHGVAAEELEQQELDYRESGYDVSIAVRARKALTAPAAGRSNPSQSRGGNCEESHEAAAVLMYHRIADPVGDPWGLCVRPEFFAQHLEVIRSHWKPVPLLGLADAAQRGKNASRCVALTFDDGYADNFHVARPLLKRFAIPATFFITSPKGQDREYWWDELDRLLLHAEQLPPVLELRIAGREYRWELGDDAEYGVAKKSAHQHWNYHQPAPSWRHYLVLRLWKLLQPLRDSDQWAVLQELKTWAGAAADCRPSHRVMTLDELSTLAADPLFEIGAHTTTHPALSQHGADFQRSEIGGSKARLEEALGIRISSFCFPYGDGSPEMAALVAEMGFACACSTIAAAVSRNSNRFLLPRLEVPDVPGDEFAAWLEERLQAT